MKWFLLWWLVTGSYNGTPAAASTGPFDSQAACKAAMQQLTWHKGDYIREVGGLCVPSEVPPASPQTGRAIP